MTLLDHFSVPFKGLKNGLHELYFEIDTTFFREFESDLVVKNPFSIKLELDKRYDIAEALFHINGEVTVECDRCLAPLDLHLESENLLRIKYGNSDLNNDEVLFINEDTSSVNFAQVIYEFMVLNIPIMKMHENIEDCDQDVITKLNDQTREESSSKSIWKDLEDLKF